MTNASFVVGVAVARNRFATTSGLGPTYLETHPCLYLETMRLVPVRALSCMTGAPSLSCMTGAPSHASRRWSKSHEPPAARCMAKTPISSACHFGWSSEAGNLRKEKPRRLSSRKNSRSLVCGGACLRATSPTAPSHVCTHFRQDYTMHACIHIHTHTHTCTFSFIYINIHTRAKTHENAYTHTRTHARAHTHAHKHTPGCAAVRTT